MLYANAVCFCVGWKSGRRSSGAAPEAPRENNFAFVFLEFWGYGKTQTGNGMSLILWKNRQALLSDVIYPAVKDRVKKSKDKMAADFADKNPPGCAGDDGRLNQRI